MVAALAPQQGREAFVPTGGEPADMTFRGITGATCARYGVRVDETGRLVFPYRTPEGALVGEKIKDRTRDADGRRPMYTRGLVRGLFGAHLAGKSKRIVVTEGEEDAMAVSQAFGNSWPAVSVPNGAQSAAKAIRENMEFFGGFERVVLLFDMDEPGREAVEECAPLFMPGRVFVGSLPRKDANETLQKDGQKPLQEAVYNAVRFVPPGLINGADLYESLSKGPDVGLDYPWPGLNEKLLGQRRGEIVMWTGGSGGGKSQFTKEVFHQLAMAGERVCIISLEETVEHAAKCQVGITMERLLHKPEVWEEVWENHRPEFNAAYERTLGGGNVWFYGGDTVDEQAILSKIDYLALNHDVQWFLIDHITMMVAETASAGQGVERQDELMYALRRLARKRDVGIHVVSQLRKPPAGGETFEEGAPVTMADLRGSGSLFQVPNMIIGIERNQQSEAHQAVARMRVVKNRLLGRTGMAGQARWDEEKGRLLPWDGPVEAYFDDAEEEAK